MVGFPCRVTALHLTHLNTSFCPGTTVFRTDLPRGQHLVTPHWLAGLLQGQTVAAAPSLRWRLFEVICGELHDFLQRHIPGAASINTECLETLPYWNKVDDTQLLQFLLKKGIARDTTVVLYGRSTTAAARVAHLLLYAGVQDVRLLDGGLTAWVNAGLPLATGAAQVYPGLTSFGGQFPACPHYMMNLSQAQALLQRPDAALASIRTRDEFTGQTSGYSYISALGDIPGARWGRAGDGQDVNSMSDYQLMDGTSRPAADIIAFWRAEGIERHLETAFYCGTGWRASLAFFYAWLMGWERISVFDGGWFEWSSAQLESERPD